MNRETKRLLKRQGQVGADGTATSRRPSAADMPRRRRRRERVSVSQFFREVREEMRQVSWPTRAEVNNYTGVVVVVLVFMTILIFGLGFALSKFVTFLFQK
jgi:preprotein translocase subunit SecE